MYNELRIIDILCFVSFTSCQQHAVKKLCPFLDQSDDHLWQVCLLFHNVTMAKFSSISAVATISNCLTQKVINYTFNLFAGFIKTVHCSTRYSANKAALKYKSVKTTMNHCF